MPNKANSNFAPHYGDANVASKMQNDLKNSIAFSLAVDEFTDIQSKPQLAVFVRYVSADLIVKEEMLDLVALKETTHSVDIKNALDKALTNATTPLDKLAMFEDLQKLRSYFTFLVNPFMVDVIKDGYPIPKTMVTETSAREMEPLELQEDQALKMMHKSQSTVEFWKQVPGTKHPQED
ncbi:unnamed protein product [Caretta caretta]